MDAKPCPFCGRDREMPAELHSLIDCWRINYGLDRDKVEAARRWQEAGGPADGPIMALATAIEWLEATASQSPGTPPVPPRPRA